jgi:hypothetical protein
MKGTQTNECSGHAALHSAIKGGETHKGSRHGGRVSLSVAVPPEVRNALRDRANALGVSLAEYITNAFAQPQRLYDTAALKQAKPLTDIDYRLRQLVAALHRGDISGARSFADEIAQIVQTAVTPLARQHRTEISADDDRIAGGWHG